MITIPTQLLNQRFIKVNDNKRPFEKKWESETNYPYDHKEFNEWLEMNNRYGVLCGINNLIVIDFDNKQLQEEVLSKLPETFTVQTARKKLLHLYFYTDKPESFTIKDKEKNTLADIQGPGKQVIGPGTIVMGTGTYTLIKDLPIVFIPIKKLHELLDPHNHLKLVQKQGAALSAAKDQRINELNKLIKISDVLAAEGIDIQRNPTQCPFHESIGGKCLGFDDTKGIWHCFNCSEGGNLIHLVSRLTKLPYADARKKLLTDHNIITDEIEDIKVSVIQALLKKDYNTATEIMATYIKKAHPGIASLKNDEKTEMYYYDKTTGQTHAGGKSLINEICRQILEENHKTLLVNQTIDKIEADTYVNQDEFFNTNYPDEILCENGILNIHTRELKKFDPEKRFFTKIPVKYELEIDCPNFKKHLKNILSDDTDIQLMQEIFGYCLYKNAKFETAFVWIGGGANGKSKTLEVLKAFLGPENVIAYSLQELENDQYAEAHLFGKYANLAGELGNDTLDKTDKFKKITGGDQITANRKFLTPINFKPFVKMIFSCNELPRNYKDDTLGFWRRWHYIKFPYTFVDIKEYYNSKDTHLLKIRDMDIITKLNTPQELAGILNWALEGLKRLLQQNHFSKSFSTEDVKRWWLMQSDSFRAFCILNIDTDYDGKIDKKELREKYEAYCKKNLLKKLNDSVISLVLKNTYNVDTKQEWGTGTRCWTGISWKKEVLQEIGVEQKTIEGTFPMEQEKYNNSILVSEESVSHNTPNKHNRGLQVGGNSMKVSNGLENSTDPVMHVMNTYTSVDISPTFDQLQSILCDSLELEIIDFLGKGFTELQLKDWLREGKIFESKPGTIRLM